MDLQQPHGDKSPSPRQFLNLEEAQACFAWGSSPYYTYQYQLCKALDADPKCVRGLFRKFNLPNMLGTGGEVPPDLMQFIITRMLREGRNLLP